MKPRRIGYALLISAMLLPRLLLAHGDRDEPVYVAPAGVDAGRCRDAASPCRTLGYAMRWVAKGGEIRVASGTLEVESAEEIFFLVGGLVDIRGGYDAAFRRAGPAQSSLIGVPGRYADVLAERGFHVIRDEKGIGRRVAAAAADMLAAHQALRASLPAAACENGQVSGMPCRNVDLLSHVGSADISARPGDAADVWGFVDLNTNREYAIVGFDIGTAVFDVTDAENPREVGFIPGQATVWRDIKVYQFWDRAAQRFHAYAYITTDGAADGLFVIDLGGLPHSVTRIPFATAGEFTAAHNIYAANTDFGTGLSLTGTPPVLIVAGSNNGGGRYRAYTTADAAVPGFIGLPPFGESGYMHDAASMLVTDARRLQCPNAGAVCEVLFDFNETTIDLWDITNPGSPALLSRTASPIAVPNPNDLRTYIHSGWASEDGRTLFVHDEFDEIKGERNRTTLRMFTLDDLRAPVPAGEWSGPTPAIDHNGFARGNRYYMSNYTRGLTILDISDPAAPVEAGFLDTFPAFDTPGFSGAWGVYPFFHSGHAAVSDIDTGFYMVADRTLDVAQGRLGFGAPSFGGAEGTDLVVPVARLGGSSGAVSVDYSIIGASADAADLAGGSGTLAWGPGDSGNRTITLSLADDGVAEDLERFLLRLSNPVGGATLDPLRVASVYVGEPGAASSVGFSDTAVRMAERGFGTAVAVVRRSGSAVGAVSVDFSLGAGDAQAGIDFFGPTSGSIDWPDGDADPRWIEFSIADDGAAEATEFFELELSSPTGALLDANSTLRIEIADGSGVNSRPTAAAGAAQSVSPGARVTLDGSASNDPDGDPLTFSWTQTAGPPVSLADAAAATTTFTAPAGSGGSTLRFSLTVTDSGGLSATAATSVQVQRSGGGRGSGGGGIGPLTLLVIAFAAIAGGGRARRAALSPAPATPGRGSRPAAR